MSKVLKTAEKDGAMKRRGVSFEDFLVTALLTPIFDPSYHTSPADPTVTWGLPTNFIGLSGIAKSAKIRAVCDRIKLPCYSVYAATKQPEDFSGVAVPTPDGLIVECILPAARKCIAKGYGVIFLDEVSCASPRVQAALLSMVNERQVGDHLLPPKTRIILAMNPAEYAAGGYQLEPPMANRMAHAWVNPITRDDFRKWLRGTKVRTAVSVGSEGEAKVIQNWGLHWPTVVGLADRFMEVAENEDLHNQPKPETDASGGAWPSPRTWHFALCGMTAARCLGMHPDIELEIFESLVGEGVGGKWLEWTRKMDLPTPTEMLTKGWDPDKVRLDRTHAALKAMTQHIRLLPRKDALIVAENAWRIVLKTYNVGLGDLAALTVVDLHRLQLNHKAKDISDVAKALSEDVYAAIGESKLAAIIAKDP